MLSACCTFLIRRLAISYLAHGCGSLPHDAELLLRVHVHHGSAHLHPWIHVRVHQHLARLLLLLELLEALVLLHLGLKLGVVRDCRVDVSLETSGS